MKLPEWLTDGLIVILILCLFLVKCGWHNGDGTTPKADTVTVVDTVYHIDTVTVNEIQTVDKWYAKHDTIWVVDFDTIKLYESDCDSIRQTVAFNSDSSVQVTSLTHGRILRQIIDSRIVNTTNTITNPVKSPRFALYGGLSVSPNTIAPELTLTRKKDLIGVGYDVLNRWPTVRYGVKIFDK